MALRYYRFTSTILRRGNRVLRSETSHCMFCSLETPHDIVETVVKPRYGPDKRATRVLDVCTQCRGFRILAADQGVE